MALIAQAACLPNNSVVRDISGGLLVTFISVHTSFMEQASYQDCELYALSILLHTCISTYIYITIIIIFDGSHMFRIVQTVSGVLKSEWIVACRFYISKHTCNCSMPKIFGINCACIKGTRETLRLKYIYMHVCMRPDEKLNLAAYKLLGSWLSKILQPELTSYFEEIEAQKFFQASFTKTNTSSRTTHSLIMYLMNSKLEPSYFRNDSDSYAGSLPKQHKYFK